MAKKSFPNSGTLGKNENRTTDKHPEYTGSAEIDGVQYWISAWVKDGAQGKKFFSLSFKPKDQQQQNRGGSSGSSNQKRNSRNDDYDDNDGVPF